MAVIVNLPDRVVGALRPAYLITWYQEDETIQNLAGATLTGTMKNEADSSDSKTITGTLAVEDGEAGQFSWTPAAADMSAAGVWRVEFAAAFGSDPTPAKSFPARLRLIPSLS